jgi:IS66 C-terminal element
MAATPPTSALPMPWNYLADILAKLVNGWPMAKIDEFLPWSWAQQRKVSLAA